MRPTVTIQPATTQPATTQAGTMEPAATLSAGERAALRALVGRMIPASAEYAVPGADDAAIFADIVATLGRDFAAVREALGRIDAMGGGAFAELPPARQEAVVQHFREAAPLLATVLEAVTLRCYYRDERVMRALGIEVRPPYPLGFEVEQGDFSLLDPVRARGKVYRDAP